MSGKYLETAEGITLHGLGFLQIKLPAQQRLHIWHPDLPKRSCFAHSAIHDHRFGFRSRVFIGDQTNRIYEATPAVGPIVTHISYLHEGARTQFGNRPWIEDQRLRVEMISEQTIKAGDEYIMSPYVYHSTEPGNDGRVATLMTKLSEHDAGAHSLCAAGVMPDADFDRKQWSEEQLWNVALDVLKAGQ